LRNVLARGNVFIVLLQFAMVLVIFSLLAGFFAGKVEGLNEFGKNLRSLIEKYMKSLTIYSWYLFFLMVFIFIGIPTLLFGNHISSNTNTSNNNDSGNSVSSTEYQDDVTSPVNFKGTYNTASLWVGSNTIDNTSPKRQMHATYTFKFSVDLRDDSRSIKKVEIQDIAAHTSLKGGRLIILPYAHADRRANGGSMSSTRMFEDWNTYGYRYLSDYSRMQSLGTTYTPTVCDRESICPFLDEVGTKSASMALRFKYIRLGEKTAANTEAKVNSYLTVHKVSQSSLSGQFSWKVAVTLDDGTVEERNYEINVDGASLDLGNSNSIDLGQF